MSETFSITIHENSSIQKTLSHKDIEKNLTPGEKIIAGFVGETRDPTNFDIYKPSGNHYYPDGFFAFTNLRFFHAQHNYTVFNMYTTPLRHIMGIQIQEIISDKKKEKGKKRYRITVILHPESNMSIRIDEEEKANELIQLLNKIMVREVEADD